MTDQQEKGRLRPASVDDALPITSFLAGLGLAMPDGPDAVVAHWRALWIDNPALSHHGDAPALGWVLEDQGEIKGFFGNIPQVSWLGDAPIRVSSARAWAVDPEYRTETPRLCDAFFSQDVAELVLISSANPPAGKRCLAFGASKMPQPDYDQILYWIVDSPGFLRAAFRKKGRGGFAAWSLGLLGSVPLDFTMRLRGRRPYGALDSVSIVGLLGLDDAFDDLWARMRERYPDKLLASRDSATLQWYFGLGAGRDEVRFVRLDVDGSLLGYAALVREDAADIGLKRLKIADFVLLDDNPKSAASLFAGAYEYAIAKGCHVLEVIGLPQDVREMALAHKPYSRPMATFPFFYKGQNEALARTLHDASSWYVTAYDGDTALL